jgi:hypothetical protein
MLDEYSKRVELPYSSSVVVRFDFRLRLSPKPSLMNRIIATKVMPVKNQKLVSITKVLTIKLSSITPISAMNAPIKKKE